MKKRTLLKLIVAILVLSCSATAVDCLALAVGNENAQLDIINPAIELSCPPVRKGFSERHPKFYSKMNWFIPSLWYFLQIIVIFF